MPTPVGHSLAGLGLYLLFNRNYNFLKDLKGFIPFFIAATAADLDFIPGLLIGEANRYHHGITHSMGASLIAAFIFSLLFRLNHSFGKRTVIFSLLFLSHIFLDYFSMDTSFPYGVPLFWPLSERYYLSVIPVFIDIQRGNMGLLFSLHNWMAAFREVLIVGPFAAILLIYRYRNRRGDLGRPRRKLLRLKTWDYFLPGPYFFTICTSERKEIFDDQIIRGKVIGMFKKIAEESGIIIHGIVVATDHLHGLITLSNDRKINLWQYISKAKVRITQAIIEEANPSLRKKIWQRSFYDHIIRNKRDFLERARYIENHSIKEEGEVFAEWH
jgi:inner membrane protein